MLKEFGCLCFRKSESLCVIQSVDIYKRLSKKRLKLKGLKLKGLKLVKVP